MTFDALLTFSSRAHNVVPNVKDPYVTFLRHLFERGIEKVTENLTKRM